MLTYRQFQVLELTAQGRTQKEISRELKISLSAIRDYSKDIRRRLNALSMPHAVAQAVGRRAQLGMPSWTAHDLRRTVLTQMGKLGIPPLVRGHVANHRTITKAGVTLGVYDQWSYEAEKRQALDLWADRLQAIIEGKGADVLPMRREA